MYPRCATLAETSVLKPYSVRQVPLWRMIHSLSLDLDAHVAATALAGRSSDVVGLPGDRLTTCNTQLPDNGVIRPHVT